MKSLSIWNLVKEIFIGLTIAFWMCLKALAVSVSSMCIVWVLAQMTLEPKVFRFGATVVVLFAIVYMIKLLIEPVIDIMKKGKKESK